MKGDFKGLLLPIVVLLQEYDRAVKDSAEKMKLANQIHDLVGLLADFLCMCTCMYACVYAHVDVHVH